jgi:hypothetical protein
LSQGMLLHSFGGFFKFFFGLSTWWYFISLSHEHLTELKSDTCRTYTITMTIDIDQFGLFVTIRYVSFSFSSHTHTYIIIRPKTAKFLYLPGVFSSSLLHVLLLSLTL